MTGNNVLYYTIQAADGTWYIHQVTVSGIIVYNQMNASERALRVTDWRRAEGLRRDAERAWPGMEWVMVEHPRSNE